MTTTTTRKQTPAQARKSALESDYTPLYAVAGLTEAVASTLRYAVAQTQDKTVQRLAVLQDRRATAETRAKATAGEVGSFVRTLPEQIKTLPETTKTRLAEVQKQAQEIISTANSTYADLAGRGKKVVDDTVIAARQRSGRAERRADEVRADVADAVDPAFEAVQETVTRARQTVTGRTATETVTPRSAAKAAATRKSAADAEEAKKEARRAAAKRAAANRAAKKAASAS